MAWSAPKTDWSADDVVVQTDMNRIEENINILKYGGDHGGNLAAGYHLTITKNSYVVQGACELKSLSTAGWSNGARVCLVFDTTSQIDDAETPEAGCAAIRTGYGANISIRANAVCEFLLVGSYWYLVNPAQV